MTKKVLRRIRLVMVVVVATLLGAALTLFLLGLIFQPFGDKSAMIMLRWASPWFIFAALIGNLWAIIVTSRRRKYLSSVSVMRAAAASLMIGFIGLIFVASALLIVLVPDQSDRATVWNGFFLVFIVTGMIPLSFFALPTESSRTIQGRKLVLFRVLMLIALVPGLGAFIVSTMTSNWVPALLVGVAFEVAALASIFWFRTGQNEQSALEVVPRKPSRGIHDRSTGEDEP